MLYEVITTLMGLGGFPGSDRQFLGMLGMHGTFEANTAMHHADVILAVGARFDDRVTNTPSKFCPDATIIHIDIDPTSISKNVKVDIPIVSDCRYALRAMNKWFDAEDSFSIAEEAARHEPWFNIIKEWTAQHPMTYKDDDTVIKPQYVIQMLDKLTGGDAIITTEVGQNQRNNFV